MTYPYPYPYPYLDELPGKRRGGGENIKGKIKRCEGEEERRSYRPLDIFCTVAESLVQDCKISGKSYVFFIPCCCINVSFQDSNQQAEFPQRNVNSYYPLLRTVLSSRLMDSRGKRVLEIPRTVETISPLIATDWLIGVGIWIQTKGSVLCPLPATC